jgi:hypothetical protein
MILLGENDGHQAQNAIGQQSLRGKGTFWLKHDEQRHPQATNLNMQEIGSCGRSGKWNENPVNDFSKQVIQKHSGSQKNAKPQACARPPILTSPSGE